MILNAYCFGVTYEGLKQVAGHPAQARHPCFGVTYEGLKLDDENVIALGLRRFGVTYEGLKQLRPVGLFFDPDVLELPMRV